MLRKAICRSPAGCDCPSIVDGKPVPKRDRCEGAMVRCNARLAKMQAELRKLGPMPIPPPEAHPLTERQERSLRWLHGQNPLAQKWINVRGRDDQRCIYGLEREGLVRVIRDEAMAVLTLAGLAWLEHHRKDGAP